MQTTKLSQKEAKQRKQLIKKHNVLIVNFMDNDLTVGEYINSKIFKSNMDYHVSFKSLMSVIKKIDNIEIFGNITEDELRLRKQEVTAVLVKHIVYDGVELIWKKVVNFIKWHNINNIKKNDLHTI